MVMMPIQTINASLKTEYTNVCKVTKVQNVYSLVIWMQKLGDIIADKTVEPECVAELKDMRRSIMEDYEISPDLVVHCKEAIEEHCGKGLEKEGKTLHCLMDLARTKPGEPNQAEMKPECRREVRMLFCYLALTCALQ